eukprot:2593645-Rhodomonas_salina.1
MMMASSVSPTMIPWASPTTATSAEAKRVTSTRWCPRAVVPSPACVVSSDSFLETRLDQFVSINIPLGVDVFDEKVSTDPLNFLFVQLGVNAVQIVGQAAGGDVDAQNNDSPLQTRTAGTLTLQCPILVGTFNKHCNGVTVKMDLKDVASMDM